MCKWLFLTFFDFLFLIGHYLLNIPIIQSVIQTITPEIQKSNLKFATFSLRARERTGGTPPPVAQSGAMY